MTNPEQHPPKEYSAPLPRQADAEKDSDSAPAPLITDYASI